VNDVLFDKLVRQASKRYESEGITTMNFARGKLGTDPVYAAALNGGMLPSGGTLLDIGCGQGLMLALLLEAGTPHFDRLVGIETRPRMARLARAALGGDAEILEADARTLKLERCSAALLFDVLQMMSPREQENLLANIVAVLEPNGVILVREADASAGWRYVLVRESNRLKAFLIGTWRLPRHYRTREEWLKCFERLGLQAEVCPTPSRNPFGNVLFRARRK
jgi:SAM-dependent methyltransferase